MRILVIGSGSIARRHLGNLRLLKPSAEVTVLRRRRSSVDTDATFNGCRIVHSLEDALAEQPVAALVASPSSLHMQTAVPMARAGIHLFVEKPIAADMSGVDELIQICDQRQLTLMVGYFLRFRESMCVFRDAIHRGDVGRPLSLRSEVGMHLPDWRPGVDYRESCSARQELGGGALLELSHEIDCAQWIVDDFVYVSAHVDRLGDLEIDVDDTAELLVRFKSGVTGSIHLDMLQRSPTRTCRVIGTEGTIEWDFITDTVRRYGADEDEWRTLHQQSDCDRNQSYVNELQHFLECVETGRQPLATGEDGRKALQVVQAARESSRAGTRVDLKQAREVTQPTLLRLQADAPRPECAVDRNGTTSRVCGFVFARGGSRGVPGKNIRLLGGKPLICHAIETGLSSSLIRRVVVSTDDPQIAAIARLHGAEVPFLRPEALATDTAKEWDAWQHAIRFLRRSGDGFDTFVSIPPTSPLRRVADVEAAIRLLHDNWDSTDLVITATPTNNSPWFNMVTIDEHTREARLVIDKQRFHHRQETPTVSNVTTVAFVAKADYILSNTSLYDGSVKAVVIDGYHGIDIDSELDFQIAEFFLQRRSETLAHSSRSSA